MNKEQAYLLHLITAAVNGTKPQKCEGINLKYLYEYSAENQFDHIIYKHFVTLGIHDEENPIMHSFHQRYGRAIVRDNAQDMTLAEISERFSENDIPHIPLKGSVVKKYYPFPEIRRSGDIDVLIHDCQKYIIIENKVNHACDQDRQLVGYIESLNGKDVYVLYLVRFDNDKDPSKNSLPAERRQKLNNDGKYKKISYQTHILNWLHKCKETDIDNELLKSALVQYCNYIEELFK